LNLNRLAILGRTTLVRIVIEKPNLDFTFKGVITFASPLNAGVQYRRLGIEFFPFEKYQLHYLLELLNEFPASERVFGYRFRHQLRLPLRVRLQFTCPRSPQGSSDALSDPGILVRSLTEDISTWGCSFQTIRPVKPGTDLRLRVYAPFSEDQVTLSCEKGQFAFSSPHVRTHMDI